MVGGRVGLCKGGQAGFSGPPALGGGKGEAKSRGRLIRAWGS